MKSIVPKARRIVRGARFRWYSDGRVFVVKAAGHRLVTYQIEGENLDRTATRYSFGTWIGKHLLVPEMR